MRSLGWLFTLASALLAASASAADILALTLSEVETVKSELLAWKASPAGREARQQGLLDSNSAITEATMDEIARFARGKQEVQRLQSQQPSAVFSMDTPYALLSYEEYLDHSANGARKPLSFAIKDEPSTIITNNSTTTITETPVYNTSTTTTTTRRELSAQADVIDIDWVRFGCVTPVEYRGSCHADWAFAAVGAIETNFCIRSPTRQLHRLSEQDVVTCGVIKTCTAWVPPTAYSWIAAFNGGSVCTEDSLPYNLRDGGKVFTCGRVDEPDGSCVKPKLDVVSYESLQYSSHVELEQIVRQRAVTAIINPCPVVQFYKSGVIRGDSVNCPTPTSFAGSSTHQSVLIVGFGSLDGIPYWKVKSSNGIYWGVEGYAYIERGYQGEWFGALGIESWITYPLFKADVPSTFDSVRVVGPRRHVQIFGQDIRGFGLMVDDANDCATACRREPTCKGYVWSYRYKTCSLKSSITGEHFLNVEDDSNGTGSGHVVSKNELLNGLCLTPEDYVDYPANDLYHTLAGSAEECCDMCFAMEQCSAYTWTVYKGGSCYLKWRRAVLPLAVAKPVPADAVSIRSGVAYKCKPLQFATDFPGNDLDNKPANGPMDCCGVCRMNAKCVGFSWTNFNGGTCWLKQAVPSNGIGSYASGVFAATV